VVAANRNDKTHSALTVLTDFMADDSFSLLAAKRCSFTPESGILKNSKTKAALLLESNVYESDVGAQYSRSQYAGKQGNKTRE
jgi:hypothetical protein